MIKALDLLAKNEVLQEGWTTLSGLQAVLIFNGTADIRSHESVLVVQVEVGQELLGICRGISVITTAQPRCLARHVRTGSIGNANEAREEGKSTHYIDYGGYSI